MSENFVSSTKRRRRKEKNMNSKIIFLVVLIVCYLNNANSISSREISPLKGTSLNKSEKILNQIKETAKQPSPKRKF